MSEHRPECIYTPEYFDPDQNIVWGGKPCICEEIERAIERVRQEIDRKAFALDEGDPYRQAYRAGLDAAREAVEQEWTEDPSWNGTNWNNALTVAIAAIDALREKP